MKLQHIPNVISLIRLAAVPALVWLATSQAQLPFAWLILAAGVTDAVDGWVARRFGWTSALGALLDSIADVMLILVAVYGVWTMQRGVFIDEWRVFAAVLSIWAFAHAAALVRYGRLASFHTHLTQFGILLFGLFILLLFFHGFVPWFFYLAAATCFVAGIENLILIIIISQWTPDLRGGLLQILRQHRASGNDSGWK
jgi:CDP-diacylglycerol--glycerol-3-phosphate 3-phosphatidyltransferase